MFVYREKISKKGNKYNKLYWRFASGKEYPLDIPLNIVDKIIAEGYADRVE